MIDVVVIGGMHHNTLGVIRSLGEERSARMQIKVLIVGENVTRPNIIEKSRYVKKGNIDYVKSEQEIFGWLRKLQEDKKKRVIICCSDGTAEAVIRRQDELKDWYYTPSTIMDIGALMSKDVQGKIALDCGLKIPVGKIFDRKSPVDWNIFPCITKPLKSVEGAGKADIHIARNKEELDSFLRETSAQYIQIQQYIAKSMEFQLIGCSLNAGQKIIIPGYTKIIRQPANTNTGYLLYSPIHNLHYDLTPAEVFLRKIGYSGLFSLEYIRDDKGEDYFLEINLRNDGNAYCVKSAGINLPYLWCYYNVYHTLPDVKYTFEKPVFFIPDFLDLKMGIKSVGLLGWLREFIQAKSHTLYNYRDMKPFIFEVYKHILSVFHMGR